MVKEEEEEEEFYKSYAGVNDESELEARKDF